MPRKPLYPGLLQTLKTEDASNREWFRGSGASGERETYVYLKPHPTDPKRPFGIPLDHPYRELLKNADAELKKCQPARWELPILYLLHDGEERTFNAIGVALVGKFAHQLFASPLDQALWNLIASGRVEFTVSNVVHFRVAQ
jgi:hypothetical protein